MKSPAIALAISFAITTGALADPLDDMLAVDTAFAAMAQDKGAPAAFAAYAAEDVRMFPDGGDSYTGRTAMIGRFAGWPEGATLEWFPQGGMAAAGGDFGYTWGRYVFTAHAPEGDTVDHGKYVSIWRKEADGSWKFVADIGNSNPAPAAAD